MQSNKAEQKDLQAIESKYYMQPILGAMQADIALKDTKRRNARCLSSTQKHIGQTNKHLIPC